MFLQLDDDGNLSLTPHSSRICAALAEHGFNSQPQDVVQALVGLARSISSDGTHAGEASEDQARHPQTAQPDKED